MERKRPGDEARPPNSPDSEFHLHTNEIETRKQAATALAEAIAECHPVDACQIMAAALDDLSVGDPVPPLDAADAWAENWASIATPHEIEAVFGAALERLDNTALGIKARKRLFLALWESFDNSDRLTFIGHVDPAGKFLKAS